MKLLPKKIKRFLNIVERRHKRDYTSIKGLYQNIKSPDNESTNPVYMRGAKGLDKLLRKIRTIKSR